MEFTPNDRALLEAFLSAVREGNPLPEQSEKVASRIKESDEFAWLYVQLSFLESALWWNYSTRADHDHHDDDFAAGHSLGATDADVKLSIFTGVERPRQLASSTARRLPAPEKTRANGRRMLAALCISASVLMLAAFVLRSGLLGGGRANAPVAENIGGAANAQAGAETGAAIVKIDNVGWVIAEGGADFKLLGPMRARLTRGLIKIRVTERAGRGFVVETPYGDVTDLGTEFGLDLTKHDRAGLLVFEGAVDLRVARTTTREDAHVEHLIGGEGVEFKKDGPINRISTVFTGNVATFFRMPDSTVLSQSKSTKVGRRESCIVDVTDNLHDSKKFYEIVPGGLREDARCYGDRSHEWNGVTTQGMPAYLIGADYVKTFNQDHVVLDQEIRVTLSRPAKLYVFLDARLDAPEWLRKDFHNTGGRMGQDAAPNGMKQFRNRKIEVGPGNSIDEQFTIWERDVLGPGVVILGSNVDPSDLVTDRGMYGIAAVALDSGDVSSSQK